MSPSALVRPHDRLAVERAVDAVDDRDVPLRAAVDPVALAVARVDGVVAALGQDRVVAGAAGDDVGAVAAVDVVVAGAAVDAVGAGQPADLVRARAPVEDVVAEGPDLGALEDLHARLDGV